MNNIITYNFGDNFIEKLSNFLCEEFLENGNDLSKVACVFGGKRPALFLRKSLSSKLKTSFLSPRIFSIGEFVDFLIPFERNRPIISQLDACFLIYTIAKNHIPALLKGRASFSEFLPWAKEIISFIEQLDLEAIENTSLSHVQKSANIGYEVPKSINSLLLHIITLRDVYHKSLNRKNLFSRGTKYLRALAGAKDNNLGEFDKILFCNFFYLHKTEKYIIKDICDKGKGICIFQGASSNWQVLKNNLKTLAPLNNLKEEKEPKKVSDVLSGLDVSLYEGFDMHSQVALVRKILENKAKKDKDNTVIVVPNPQALIPLLTEISSITGQLNVSMGYPITLSPIYALFCALWKVHESKKGAKYYMKDYLALLSHPFIKNLNIAGTSDMTRVMVHKIEELLRGSEESDISGNLFLELSAIENEEKIYLRTSQTLANMDIVVSSSKCKHILCQLHDLLLNMWSHLTDFKGFSKALRTLLDELIAKGKSSNFAFNIKIFDKLYAIAENFKGLSFAKEPFKTEDIWEIFRQRLESERVSFIGSPLVGTQVLGLLEARSLNFKNVIVMDMNESILPKLKIYEPLIPREVMLSLGLNRLENEEEIQRYQFMNLIACARSVHLVYEENQVKEKSRFIQELIWIKQAKAKKMCAIAPYRASFSMKILEQSQEFKKTHAMCEFLKKQTYSASRLNTYLNCPLRFFYQYVLGLREKDDYLGDPEARTIGDFIHELLEDTFRQFKGRRPLIDAEFRENFFKKMKVKFDKYLKVRMRSDSFLVEKIIEKRLNDFLDEEIKRNVSKVLYLEERRRDVMNLESLGPIQFEYRVDRVDELEDKSIMVIDYKTGGSSFLPKKLKGLKAMVMNRQSIKENLKSFQLPLYYYFTSKAFSDIQVNAQIYNIRSLERKVFIRNEDLRNKEEINQICLKAFNCILLEIFNPEIDFVADKDERRCKTCPFKLFCH